MNAINLTNKSVANLVFDAIHCAGYMTAVRAFGGAADCGFVMSASASNEAEFIPVLQLKRAPVLKEVFGALDARDGGNARTGVMDLTIALTGTFARAASVLDQEGNGPFSNLDVIEKARPYLGDDLLTGTPYKTMAEVPDGELSMAAGFICISFGQVQELAEKIFRAWVKELRAASAVQIAADVAAAIDDVN